MNCNFPLPFSPSPKKEKSSSIGALFSPRSGPCNPDRTAPRKKKNPGAVRLTWSNRPSRAAGTARPHLHRPRRDDASRPPPPPPPAAALPTRRPPPHAGSARRRRRRPPVSGSPALPGGYPPPHRLGVGQPQSG